MGNDSEHIEDVSSEIMTEDNSFDNTQKETDRQSISEEMFDNPTVEHYEENDGSDHQSEVSECLSGDQNGAAYAFAEQVARLGLSREDTTEDEQRRLKKNVFPYEDIYPKNKPKNVHLGGMLIGIVSLCLMVSFLSFAIAFLIDRSETIGSLRQQITTTTPQQQPSTVYPGSFVQPESETSDVPHTDKLNTDFDPGETQLTTVGHGEKSLTRGEIYEAVNPVTVLIVASNGSEGDMKTGTGVIVSEDGFVITNQHVIADRTFYTVVLSDGASYTAILVAESSGYDLAVLKINANNLPVASFGDSALVREGDAVCAIGNPVGISLRSTFTAGIISATNRVIETDNAGTMVVLQTDTALNGGNSGGPLINEYGQIIGINSNKISSMITSAEGLGFAIPSNTVCDVINALLSGNRPAADVRLGIMVDTVGKEIEQDLFGIQVQYVEPGSVSETAGIAVGDYIVKADNRDIRLSFDLVLVRKQHKVGDSIPVTIYRDGQIFELTVEMLNEA